MKLILKIACVSLMFGNFMFGSLDFNGFKRCLKNPLPEDFFVTVITRNGKEALRPAEINFLKLFLSCLFNGLKTEEELSATIEGILSAEENIGTETEKGVPGYLETLHRYKSLKEKKPNEKEELISILRSCLEPKEDTDTLLEKLKNATGLVAFNEYFLGKTPFPHDIAETYAKSFSQDINNYLFACNFLTYSQMPATVDPKSYIDYFNDSKNREFGIEGNQIKYSTVETGIDKKSISENENLCMMENKTFYTLNNEVVSTYNKSSYCDENDDFLSNENVFYYFGDWKDHQKPNLPQITNHISTEICRDLPVGRRQNDNGILFHLIQANGLRNMMSYTNNLPIALCYIFCDPCVMRKDILTRKREALGHIYYNNIAPMEKFFMPDVYYSFSFELHCTKIDINIYKIN